MQCQKKYLRVDRRQIGFMKFIFEAYEGIANLTTIERSGGHLLDLINDINSALDTEGIAVDDRHNQGREPIIFLARATNDLANGRSVIILDSAAQSIG